MKLAIVIACENSPIAPSPVPSDSSAVTSGRAIASNEPNTRNSTIPAAMMPKPTPPRLAWLACSIAGPPSSTRTAPPAAAREVLITCLIAGSGRSFARASNVIVANATVPLGEICRAAPGAYGDTSRATCGRVATRASIGAIRSRTAGSVTRPELVATTIWSLSPAAFGDACCSRSSASVLCVPCSVKLSE